MTRGQKPVTVSMIARGLNLSVTTVSFVLNGLAKQYGIADSTVQRVHDAAKKLHYVPNVLARSLRHRKSGLVGVIFPHLKNDWAHHIMGGMYDAFEREGLVPFIVNHRDSPEQESREIDLLIQRRAEGILCNPIAGSAASYRRVLDNGLPLVFFADTLKELPQVGYAAWDPKEAALAVQHLADTGRKRIAYLGFDDPRVIARARNDAVRRALERNGLPVRDPLFTLSEPHTDIKPRVAALMKSRRDRPDALFAVYDDTAMDAMDELERLGVRVPDDVAVATLADSKLTGPRGYDLTTVSAPIREEGLAAAKIMIRLLKNPGSAPTHVLVPGGKLIVRGTT